jgi:uncharacterized protein (TIGR02328 family)
MRLWHQSLIPYLPNRHLGGQHRECCALRGKGWFKRHSTVQYALDDKFEKLIAYHFIVIDEMEARNMNVASEWTNAYYRGRSLKPLQENELDTELILKLVRAAERRKKVYSEHNSYYMNECLLNLSEKGIYIDLTDNKQGEANV